MDLGLGGFIEKFEAYLGKRATFLLLLIIGLAVASYCLDLIYRIAIKPVYDLVRQAIDTQVFDIYFFTGIATNLSFLLLVIIVASNIATSVFSLKTRRTIDVVHSKSMAVFDCLEIAQGKLKSTAKTIKDKKLVAEIDQTLSEIHEKLKTARALE